MSTSEIAALLLLPFDGLEECFEVALAKSERTMSLDELKEHRRPVAERFSEDLQQVAVFVAVHQDAPLLQLLDRDADVADAGAELRILVVRVGRSEELDAFLPECVDGLEDVVRCERKVLSAWSTVELEVLVDLRLLAGD